MAPMSHLISSVTNGDEESAEKVQVVYQNLGPRLANPSPLAMAGFATSLLTVSLSMMGFRGVSNQTVFVGDLCFVACIALLISAQWEMVRGNTFSYTVLSAFDGNTRLSIALMKAAGVFGFLAGLLGFYTTAHYLCQDVLPFHIPMGDTSGLVKRWKKAKIME
ncbi:hypothetical protein ACSS6W_007519 [Trichoderma asperelloides]